MSDDQNKNQNPRWWEYYFVRYFVGTVVGSFIIIVLLINKPLFPKQNLVVDLFSKFNFTALDPTKAIIVGAMGLAFCYVASSPILVLHAVRGQLFQKFSANRKLVIFLVVISAILGVPTSLAFHATLALNKINLPLLEEITGWFILLLADFLVASQIGLIIHSMFAKKPESIRYYQSLTVKRTNPNAGKQEYIESYRHLREHGNAYLILVLEMLLGAALYYSPIAWGIPIALWVLPAALVWFFGTRLEKEL